MVILSFTNSRAVSAVCLCLMAFQEAGLLSDGPDGIFSAQPVRISGKADLEATRLLRSLRSMQ